MSLFFRSAVSRSSAAPLLSWTASSSIARSSYRSRFLQSRSISDDLKLKLDQIVKDNRIVVFMKGNKETPQCGFSNAVIQVLTIQGLDDYKTINVLADDQVRSGIKEYSEWPTIPQVYIDGEFIGGCDILIKMHKSGELRKLLIDSKLVSPSIDESNEK